MKIIHAADLHLGSKIEAKLSPISDERKREVRNSFMRLAEYAEKNDIHIILLSGDVFDSDKPFKKDKDTFYAVIDAHPNIDFLYLRGNHDTDESNNETERPNLKTFSSEWKKYSYENVDISGLELDQINSYSFYGNLNLEPNKVNIVMLHGQESSSIDVEKIKISKLKDKNIDYLALGHIHAYKEGRIDNRGVYCYSGCLEGRGFDETGEKGFVLLDIEGNKVNHSFVRFASRLILDEEVDISNTHNIPEIAKRIKETIHFNNEDIYRVTLMGDLPFDLEFNEKDIESSLYGVAHFINIKDKTLPLIDSSKYENDLSIKGEFVRLVYSKADLSEEEKRKIISLGLRTLIRGDVEL